jgi:hypothetical protein
MGDKKIAVPEWMIAAISEAGLSYGRQGLLNHLTVKEATLIGEAVCWAIAENPIVPTKEQRAQLACDIPFEDSGNGDILAHVCGVWQRRMFFVPEQPCIPPHIESMLQACTFSAEQNIALKAFIDERTQPQKFQFDATGFERQTGCRPNWPVDKDGLVPEMDGVDYYRKTPDGRYVKIDGPVDTTPMPEATLAESLVQGSIPLSKEDSMKIELLINGRNTPPTYSQLRSIAGDAYRMGQQSKEKAQ